MRSTLTTVMALLPLIAVMPIAAQTERPLLVGARVRITMPDTTRADERSASARPVVVIGQLLALVAPRCRASVNATRFISRRPALLRGR